MGFEFLSFWDYRCGYIFRALYIIFNLEVVSLAGRACGFFRRERFRFLREFRKVREVFLI